MKKLLLASGILGSIAMGFAASAHAVPITSTPLAETPRAAQSVAYRHCVWRDGRRSCRFVFGYRDRDGRGHKERHGRWSRHRDRD
jgi:hypothetical protein